MARRAARQRGEQRILQSIAQVRVALEQFRQDVGRYPTTAEGLAALVDRPPGATGDWHQGFAKLPKDGWDRPFVYQLSGDGGFRVYSLGSDGQDGTDDDVGAGR